MRLPLLLACVSFIASGFAAEVQLVRVWPAYRDIASFQRLSEYFTGRENASGETFLRSQPNARAGYYFLLRTESSATIDTVVEVSVIRPGHDQPDIFTFPAQLPAGSHATQAGLTGADWPDPTAHPLAWRVRLLSPDGALLAGEQSFLWALPAE